MADANERIAEERGFASQDDPGATACAPDRGSLARGACPSLSTPMLTGDGLLVRLHPTTPGLSIPQFRALAEAAQQCGNGLVEITARGNLQLRGMTEVSMSGLAADITRAGIVPETGVTIEVPPLSGLDALEIADARDMAARLKERITAFDPKLLLAPKLAIIIDAGGRVNLDALSADIRLNAVVTDDGAIAWNIAIGGTASTAQRLATLSADTSISTVIELLKTMAERGPRTRGRDLDADDLREKFRSPHNNPLQADVLRVAPLGIHHLGETDIVLGLRPSFGQIHSRDIIRFLDVAEAAGAKEIRTAPEHVLLVLGIAESRVKAVQLAAANSGFQTEVDDPTNQIAVCAGAGACASAFYSTKSVAADVIELAPDLLDGSLTVHLSGCRKGCARPGDAALAFVGAPIGYGIVVNGSASATPVAYIGREAIKSTLAQLAELLRNNKVAGESAKECLTRLGTDAIVTAMRQG